MKTKLSQDYLDRFSGISRLYGDEALTRLQGSHIAVIGIGGVGSWSAEAVARTGVGRITLIDLDDICVTNINRQLPALDREIGRPKASVVAERLRQINPECEVTELIEFFTEANAERILSEGFDCVIDAIDSVSQKAFLISACRDRKIPLVVSGGAGGKSDPTQVARDDLAFATNDRLLKQIRKKLRNEYGFPPVPRSVPFGIPAVYSRENARYPWSDGTVREEAEPGSELRLNCDSGFGTATPVTGTFGFAAAAEAIRLIIER